MIFMPAMAQPVLLQSSFSSLFDSLAPPFAGHAAEASSHASHADSHFSIRYAERRGFQRRLHTHAFAS